MVWEAMAAVEDMLCLTAMTMMMTPLMMPFVWGILCGMHLVTMQGTQVVCCYAHPCFKGHTVVAIIWRQQWWQQKIAILCLTTMTMMMMPLMMPFIQGVLFGMHLVNSQETEVVCCKAHPCFEGHTMVAIVMETTVVVEDR
jgi:hypothetical protein